VSRRANVQILVMPSDQMAYQADDEIVTIQLPGDWVVYGYADGLRNLRDTIDSVLWEHDRVRAAAIADRIADLTDLAGGAA
jgi:hypothetical protein